MKLFSTYLIALLVVFILILIPQQSAAQSLFNQHTIDDNFIGACSVCAYDLDGDGQPDVLASGSSGNHIAWWKVTKDSSLKFTKFVIDSNVTSIIYVDAADVDSDGDLDVLGACWYGNEVVYWKNSGGSPINWKKVVVDDSITKAHEIHGAYVDADTLLDLIVASGGDNQIIWYRNKGGEPIIWEKNIVDSQFAGARSVVSYDINNDGFNDLIGAALNANQISIWFNSGTTPVQWTKQVVDNSFGGAHWVHASDIDKDGDLDLIAAGAIPGSIAWWRNDGGDPIQWTKQIITGSFSGALSVYAADLDLDSNIDVFGAATNINQVRWWKNDGGTPVQWSSNLILSGYGGAWPVFGIDLDNDGDTDILTAASSSNKISWLENTTVITHLEGFHKAENIDYYLYQNYPNPFNPTTTIKYQISRYAFVTLKVYNVLGNVVAILVNEKKKKGNYKVIFNAEGLSSGTYFYRLSAGNYSETKKMCFIQ